MPATPPMVGCMVPGTTAGHQPSPIAYSQSRWIVTPGSTVVFPKGWAGTWTIHETLRKVYVIFS